MFYSLQKLFRSAPKAARPAQRTQLRLECLEARVTPSRVSLSHSFDGNTLAFVNAKIVQIANVGGASKGGTAVGATQSAVQVIKIS